LPGRGYARDWLPVIADEDVRFGLALARILALGAQGKMLLRACARAYTTDGAVDSRGEFTSR